MALFQEGMIGPLTTPNLNSQVDYEKETVEGRVGNILKTDGQGNYSNPVVKQAVQRQDQAFNSRGLLNSSIAVQGGTEAAISKAIEIASPDAKTYYDNRRSNVNTENEFASQRLGGEIDLAKQKDSQGFTLRQDYQKAVQTVGTNFQRQLDTINASAMSPEDKSVAIQQAQAVRDGEIAFQNNLYSRMPTWQSEWLSASVPAGGLDMSTVTNRDTLVNIINDPGQTQAARDAAAARLAALNGGAGGGGGGGMIGGGVGGGSAPGAPTAANGQALPSQVTVGFFPQRVVTVNWDSGNPTLRQQYENAVANGIPLSPTDWYMQTYASDPATAGGGEGGAGGGE